MNTNDTWLAPAHGKGNASSGPTFRSKLLRRLASRLAIIASKHFVYKLGIQSGTLHAWYVVVASLLPWLTMARACFAASYFPRITEGRALFFENCQIQTVCVVGEITVKCRSLADMPLVKNIELPAYIEVQQIYIS